VLTNLLPVVSLTALVITTQGTSATQESLEQTILSRAVASIRNAEPEWQFAAVAATGLIMDEQLGVAAGHWFKVGGGVIAWIYRISTEEAAESWVLRLSRGLDVKGLTIQTYGLGDRAIIATYVTPRFTQYVLWIRKDKFLVKLDSVSKEHIEQFAKILIAEISS
jgi:hypothetical protein